MKISAAEQYRRVKTKRQYIDFYKNKVHAQDYAGRDLKGANPLITEVETQVVMTIAKRYLSPKKSRLLDVATGSGRIVKVLENHFGESIGVDTSARMLAIARKRTSKTLLELADIENLPFENNTVDCITGFRLLINIPRKNRRIMLTELRRVLKDKGILAMNVHLNTLSPRGIRDIIVRSRPPEKMISYFGIKQELNQAGFKVIHVQGVNMLVLYNLFPFIPHAALVKIDKFTGGFPPIAYVSDTFIVFAQKTSLDKNQE